MTKQSLTKIHLLRAALAILFIFAMVDCGSKSSDSSTAMSPTLTALYQNVFSQTCVQCHNGSTNPNGSVLNFSSIDTSYQTLLGHVTATDATGCSGILIVNPNNVSTSYIAAVLISSYYSANFAGTSCAPYAVHLQDTNLTADEQSALVNWIASGAAKN